eukprot:GHRQ01035718.1.p3 GENE.GHRQ01035718.1~~GHRQ01035718.1.p3  ORF type:complete len:103 (-),score=25.10 GHRQ01035718.1:779-1087(-)
MGDMQAAADWSQPEETDGIRLTWNLWPNSKLEATKCVIPFAAMYTPNKRLPNMPVRSLAKNCRTCKSSRAAAEHSNPINSSSSSSTRCWLWSSADHHGNRQP